MRYGDITLRVKGSGTTWNGPHETVRIDLVPEPPYNAPGETWTLEIRGPNPPNGTFFTAKVVLLNVPLPDNEGTTP